MNAGKEFLIGALVMFIGVVTSEKREAASTRPHIVFIFADDLGWNDVSFHGSPEIPTPNIDSLAMNGITLHNYYVEPACTPSRGALMTGEYPIRTGMQTSVFKAGETSGLPLNRTILPQHLKNLGYSTHMVGKWHLGYSTWEYTPTYRGFDTFFGYYNGLIDYYDFTVLDRTELNEPTQYVGSDLHNGTEHLHHYQTQYAVDVFTDEAVNIISKHDVNKPLFLYLSQAAVHSGNLFGMPEQAPPEIVEKFLYIEDYNRRIHAARMWTLDLAVGSVISSLQSRGMLENSIVIFSSDNGGEVMGEDDGYSSNHPLRGRKGNVWEGGCRVPGLIWSPLLTHQQPRISTSLMHITDWLPTLYAAAGGNESDLGTIDGLNQWPSLLTGAEDIRTNLLYNIDPTTGIKAYRENDMKAVRGSDPFGYDFWYGPSGFEYTSKPASMEEWVFQNGSIVRDILQDNGMWTAEDIDSWYAELVVQCLQPPPAGCNASANPCLFNVTDDPCEYTDISSDHPELVQSLMQTLADYEAVMVQPQSKPSDPRGNPMCNNYTYVPFLEPEYNVNCNPAANTNS